MTTIDVWKDGAGDRFTVDVRDDDGTGTTHSVRVTDADWARFGGGRGGRLELLDASFRFLLIREPKESILGSFDLDVIASYFPEYGETFTRRAEA